MQYESDAELVARARCGDKPAFDGLTARYFAMARRVARRMVANDDAAQDLAQEAILQAYLSLDQLRDDARFQSWLYGIVLNLCRSFLREQKTHFFSLESLPGGLRFDALMFSGAVPEAQELAEARELRKLVLNAIQTLSPENREATLLFYYDQLSLLEIAASLQISVSAVKGRLYKARQQLGEQLVSQYPELIGTSSSKRRRSTMIKVSIADVVKRERADDQGQTLTNYIVVLQDDAHTRALPIWIGAWEGQAIAMGMRGLASPRPMTFKFMADLLDAAGAALGEVRIEKIREDVYYAVAKIRSGNATREIDARPSDALALAVRVGCPIYVAEDVLKKCGMDIPAEAGEIARTGKGVEDITRELEESWSAERLKRTYPRTEEEMVESQKELLTAVFGT